MSFSPGTRLGPFEVLALIGAGGMGEVYRARDDRLGRDVAIKVLPPSLAADADRLRRFEQEARAVAALNHPNVVQVYDVGSHQGAPYLVCELLEGENLRAPLQRGVLPQRRALDYALQAARGLAAAHEKGIFHRDLKPENLFIQRGGRLKILDFGLAKLRSGEKASASAASEGATLTAGHTYAGAVMGTVGYMSPEQVRGQPADHRSDIFGFGAVLYEMLCGRRAFHRDSAVETMNAILHEEAIVPAEAAAELSPALQRILQRCLEKEPEQRFQSASDMAFALEALTPDASSGHSSAAVPTRAGPPGSAEPAVSPARPRLESWKEIASFLKRDVRTVKRWETEEGLPVHRHHHKKLASVYAYQDELETWQRNRQPRPEPREPAPPPQTRRWKVAAVLLLAAALPVIGYFGLSSGPPAAPEHTWVLVGRFENRTGEEVFDATVEYTLERELSNSRSMTVVPHERIADALELMRKPPNTPLDRDVAREVCLRDGGIQTMITGRVEKLAGTYVLSAEVIDPVKGVVVAGMSEEAGEQGQVVPALRRLSDRLREALGERLADMRGSEAKLERVTTNSLRAVHLYTRAYAATLDYDWAQAAGFLRGALEEDAEFASAHQLLAHCLHNSGRQQEALPHFERAFRLSDTVAEPERSFIRSGYFRHAAKDTQKATEALLTLLQLYPDHYWATNNLWYEHRVGGRPRQALTYVLRRADLRPNQVDYQLQAAYQVLAWGDVRQAEPYRQRAQQLMAAAGANDWRNAWRGAALRLYPVHEAWMKADGEKALRELEGVAAQARGQSGPSGFALLWAVGSAYLVLGKTQAAREVFATLPAGPADYVALSALALGDEVGARRHLEGVRPSHRAAILALRTGSPMEAEKALSHPETLERAYAPFLPRAWTALLAGELALAKGETQEAIPLLEEATRTMQLDTTAFFFLGSDALARAWVRQGNPAKALEVLERASLYRNDAVFWGPAPLFWMRNELLRAQLYRQSGREAEAQKIDRALVKLLAAADGDHPIVREMQAARSAASSPAAH